MPDRKLRLVEKMSDLETPASSKFHLRGHEIVVTEMPAEDYEDAMRGAQLEDGKVDMPVMERLLALGSVTIDGESLEAERWGKFPAPVTSRIIDEVKKVHWTNLDTDEELEAKKAAARAAAKAADDLENGRKPKPVGDDIPNS